MTQQPPFFIWRKDWDQLGRQLNGTKVGKGAHGVPKKRSLEGWVGKLLYIGNIGTFYRRIRVQDYFVSRATHKMNLCWFYCFVWSTNLYFETSLQFRRLIWNWKENQEHLVRKKVWSPQRHINIFRGRGNGTEKLGKRRGSKSGVEQNQKNLQRKYQRYSFIFRSD